MRLMPIFLPITSSKPKCPSATGYTLVELVAILVIVGIIAVGSQGLMSSGDNQRLQSSRDQVLLALRSARHMGMAKASSSRAIEFISNAANDTIDVRDSGSSISLGGVSYPIQLNQGVDITSSTVSFDKMGRATSTAISLSTADASVSVVISSSGAAQ